MNPEIEKLIDLALADGKITDKERSVILKKAVKLGEDPDEVEMILDGRFHESKKLKTKEKVGNIKVCPSCGSPVKSFISKCQDCGHEFRNIEVNNSISRLFDLLNEVENTKTNISFGSVMTNFFSGREDDITEKKKTIITNFPIPNTKESILEFLSTAIPKSKRSTIFQIPNGFERQQANSFANIWKKKCEQIILKARFTLKDDKVTLNEIEYYAKQLKIK